MWGKGGCRRISHLKRRISATLVRLPSKPMSAGGVVGADPDLGVDVADAGASVSMMGVDVGAVSYTHLTLPTIYSV